MNESMNSVLRFESVGQFFMQAGNRLDILKDVSFSLKDDER